jgi:hypothetical protein
LSSHQENKEEEEDMLDEIEPPKEDVEEDLDEEIVST